MNQPDAVQSLARAAADALGPAGALAAVTPGYQPRDGQLRMAQAVAHTVEHGGVLAVEAATGVGKTFAYLVPALLARQRVLFSTATKTLQDQLFGRDIPHLLAALGVPLKVAMLKGRSSYVCPQRLQELSHAQPHQLSPQSWQQVHHVRTWATATQTGDLAEMPDLDEQSPLMPWITSTRDNCLGGRCPQVAQCFVNRARAKALAADVVVVNHHLFFADMHVRESGVAELLPSVRAVIFDEAHQLNEIGVRFLSVRLSSQQLQRWASDVLHCGLTQARGLADWQGLTARMQALLEHLHALGLATHAVSRIQWPVSMPSDQPDSLPMRLQAWLVAALRVLAQGVQALQAVAELSPELQVLHARTVSLHQTAQRFAQAPTADCVRWVETQGGVRWHETPLDIAPAMQAQIGVSPDSTQAGKSWIFTSATLGVDAGLQTFLAACGIPQAQTLHIPSPFDYAAMASLYVPKVFPKPADPSHSEVVAQLAWDCAQRLGGRTLVLCTSLRAMHAVAQYVRQAGDLPVWVQGEMPKRELLARFIAASEAPGRGGMLVASASFWEGVDVPGDALQLVVIDKIPFAPPDDPWVQAQAEAATTRGDNAFHTVHLTQAALALKQGAGRLIRSETDRGILIIADVRLRTMGYGRKLLEALPPMRPLDSDTALQDALESLTKSSTKDPYCETAL